MPTLYDARGNLYIAVTPAELRSIGIDIPNSAEAAALSRPFWTKPAIERLCQRHLAGRDSHSKAYCSDGLLVGPFQSAPPFDLLVVNTDGSLAERSGNGMTIFAQAQMDRGFRPCGTAFTLRVHHDQVNSPTPVACVVQPATTGDVAGFWLDLGQPAFGPEAVGAKEAGLEISSDRNVICKVRWLSELNTEWRQSVFVRIGNPHCVTFVQEGSCLPTMGSLGSPELREALARIAFAGPLVAGEAAVGSGEPCPYGINLQWAAVKSPGHISARIFERGEGPTASSGTSASAVACAAWIAGLTCADTIQVEMPGGTAPVRLRHNASCITNVQLFGTAVRSTGDIPPRSA